jgi:hypothetical protein
MEIERVRTETERLRDDMFEFGRIIYTGRRKSKFKIGLFFRIIHPGDIIELTIPECDEMCRNHSFKPYNLETTRAIRFYQTPPGMFSLINGFLKGRRCFIIGRGSSLIGFDFSILKNEYVIVCNEALLSYPQADAIVFCDRSLWVNNKDMLAKFDGWILAAERTGYYDVDRRKNVIIFPLGNLGCGQRVEDGMYCGASSAMLAINIAECMQASEVYLLGLDLNVQADRKYFDNFTDEPKHYSDNSWVREHLKMYHEHFRQYTNVYNCNPKSAIKTFPFVNVKDVINAADQVA